MKVWISGATGNVGKGLVAQLLAAGASVRAVTRDRAHAHLPDDVEIVDGDPSQPTNLRRSFGGVDAMFVTPRSTGSALSKLMSIAYDSGVRRVVLISAITVEFGGGDSRFIEGFRAAEYAAKTSGLDWTILRCADFDANARIWIPQIRSSDIVRGAYGDAATACIHERDIAAVAARVLTGGRHSRETYALTGPASVSQSEKVRAIGEAVGRNVQWEEMPAEDVRAAMIAVGTPAEIPERMLGYLSSVNGKDAPLTTTVRDLLGRDALSFGQWATDHAAEFENAVRSSAV